MTSICKEWTQPDGLHFRGLCGNEFMPKTGADGCNVCITPEPRTPPSGCFGCSSIPTNEWPNVWVIRGGEITRSDASPSGLYHQSGTNAFFDEDRFQQVKAYGWADVAGFFNGARLTAITSSSGSPTCQWVKGVLQTQIMLQRPFVNTGVATVCGQTWSFPRQYESFTYSLINYPLLVKQVFPGSSDSLSRVQNIITSASYSKTLPYYESDLSVAWPSGFGSLSGTRRVFGTTAETTDIPYDVGCPSVGYWAGNWGNNTMSLTLDWLTGTIARLRFVPATIFNTTWTQLFDKTINMWVTSYSGRPFPTVTGTTLAPPPAYPNYSVEWQGTVDCNDHTRITMTRTTSGVGVNDFPLNIQLVSE